MRLFIAINFSEEIKSKVYEQELKLQEKMLAGHITKKENIHLTSIFIGEVTTPKEISDCLSHIQMEKFNILIKGLKYFVKKDSKLYYLEIQNNKNLVDLYNFLYDELTMRGFNINYQEYKPHITLAREVKLQDIPDLKELNQVYTVDAVSLMESKRVNGELKYIEICSQKLK